MVRKLLKHSFIFVVGALLICSYLTYFLLFTTSGGCFILKRMIAGFAQSKSVAFRKARGSIMRKMTLEDIQVNGLSGFPKGGEVIIKQADIWLTKLSREGLHIAVQDGSLFLPQDNRISFSGNLKGSIIDLSIHSDLVNVQRLSQLLPGIVIPQGVSGSLSDVVIAAKGPLGGPTIYGTCIAGNVIYEDYIIKKVLCKVTATPELEKEKTFAKVLVILDDMEIGLREIPESQAKIQKTEIEFDLQNIGAMKIKVSNGRVSLPGSDPILFYGDYTGGSLNFNIYSKNTAIDSLAPFFAHGEPLAFAKGSLQDVDLFCVGTIQNPIIKGTALVGKIDYKSFSLSNAPLVCNILLNNKAVPAQVSGTVLVKRGQISGPGSVFVQLEESKLLFSGDYSNPSFDIKGNSTVEKTKIQIVLMGTSDKPELKLSSDPTLPQEQLLVMLATGKKWSGIGSVLSNGVVTPDLALDFIDYFVLGGGGSKIADKFGITGFSVTLDKAKTGVEVKKSVTDKVEVGYGVLQTQNKDRTQEITQKVSGELRVTDSISVGAEKELKQPSTLENPPQEQKANDKVMIKFKKNF
ncbi:MAG: translocation/assembly module TamB [Candidatus Omnitrophica bacterium]|nr:translocation/assembly module TamB [Candidatus Omnitrophota bacterium]